MNYNQILELLNRDDVTEAEWQEAEAYLNEETTKHWQDYLERRQNYDDAVFSEIHAEIGKTVRNRGISTQWVLTRDEEIVPAIIVEGRYGQVWAVKKDWGYDAELVEWVNVSTASTIEKEQVHYAKKGYQIALAEFKVRYNDKSHRTYLDRSTGTIQKAA